ncbi:MAG: hypothetical protein CFH21_01004 [Alphaproteobacteria bacterium MarineAlpha5_Bin11]|nr:hypothetical protein [Pelagibacteraceae bacterium]PPR42794.1 MAG: hypothetical protein CFH21_01004 [Alphaproteobacteria bacterium MarineAlpha5_Bin11]PPR51358.1 MAG: hypothetical protein CFH20_00673 [Alphaproteobacteria bacterium MarineAlpha5_Bin10]
MNYHFYLLRWLIPNSILVFIAIGAWHYGFLFQLYSNDKSYISSLITIIYFFTSLHCLYKMYFISDQINLSDKIKDIFINNSETKIRIVNSEININYDFKLTVKNHLTDYIKNFIKRNNSENDKNNYILLDLFSDKLKGEVKIGSFISDSLFKLGLLGTIIGFVLMLQPISNIDSFDEISIKNALTSMSAGMSIALFTTLSGLIGGLLLKMQYYFLEDAAEKLFHQTSELSEIYLSKASK